MALMASPRKDEQLAGREIVALLGDAGNRQRQAFADGFFR
jgi:hypothetical protein